MDVDTGDSLPVSSRPYTLPLKHYEWVQREMESLECAGVITKSMSPWSSPIVIVPKKSDPREPLKRRLCVDFRKVNELQQQVIIEGKSKGQISIHPLPKIDEMYAKLKGARVFSTIDLRSGYHHIALGKDSRAKIAFVTPFSKYNGLMVPFGLAQAPAYFLLLMNKVLERLSYAMTYLDDIIIFSSNELEHLEHLEEVFCWLRKAGLKMKCSKCDFFKSKIHYLGHLISSDGISPLPDKLDTIKNMPVLKDVKEIKQFLGLTGYYRKFVPRFADISRPLTALMKKETKFMWTTECQKLFELLKSFLCGEPTLKYADTSKPYTLYTDASKRVWAGILTQSHKTVTDGKSVTTDHPVAFVSGLFRGSQLNWAALMKEAYAIYMSVKMLSLYLTQAEVLLKSDHLPLKRFLHKNTLNSKVNNWAMELKKILISQDYYEKLNENEKEGKYSSEKIESYVTLFESLLAPKLNPLLAVEELHFAKQGSMNSGEFYAHVVKIAKRCKFPCTKAEERAIRDTIFLGMNSTKARDKAINLMNEEGKEIMVDFLMQQLEIEDCNVHHKSLSRLDSSTSINFAAYDHRQNKGKSNKKN